MSQLTSNVAQTLKAYGVSKGYNLPDQFYSDMSWGGLTNLNQNTLNPIFTELVTSNNVRNRILNTIDSEALNETVNGVSPKGKVCN